MLIVERWAVDAIVEDGNVGGRLRGVGFECDCRLLRTIPPGIGANVAGTLGSASVSESRSDWAPARAC